MATVDEVMSPYVHAETLEDAEAALDALPREYPLPERLLGDCYDELAEAAAQHDELAAAARLERKAIEAGCSRPTIAREMLGWYLLGSGAIDAGEAVFHELREEQPEDSSLVIGLGHARSQAGLQAAALAAFDEAVEVAKQYGPQNDLDRARIERRAEREHVGLPADEDDRLAPDPRPLPPGPVVWTVAWFPPDQQAAAAKRWPALDEDLADPQSYARRLEQHLHELRDTTGRAPCIAPLDVAALAAWAEQTGHDPGKGAARSLFAAEVARTGHARSWPPGRNEPCWCDSGRKYKRCCGGA
jgi:tetratricopeptide (TPR) repeat protein